MSEKFSTPMYSPVSQFFLQMRVMLWKNATLKIRFWYIMLLELAIPAIFLLGLAGIKQTLSPSTVQENLPKYVAQNSPSFISLYQQPACDAENLVWRCNIQKKTIGYNSQNCSSLCEPRRIAIAASSPSVVSYAQDFTAWANIAAKQGSSGNQPKSL